jgi:dihydroorotate dehydrogenase (fumarate)
VVDLATRYLGLNLASPLIPSASPLSRTLDTIRRMEENGAGALVLFSLFQEQIVAENGDRFVAPGEVAWAATLEYLPDAREFRLGPEEYLEHVARAKAAVGIPVIGSLNGAASGQWTHYGRLIEQAGADALEVSLYQMPVGLGLSSDDVEKLYVELVREIRSTIAIPLAVKIGPYFGNVADFARRLTAVGANGLVLFNRFCAPDVDLDALEMVHRPRLSSPGEPITAQVALHWIATLRDRVPVELAASGGIHRAEDVLKAIAAGASVAQMAGALMTNGVEGLRQVNADLKVWLAEHNYRSLDQLRGRASYAALAAPGAYSRAKYLRLTGGTHPPGLPWSLVSGEPSEG